MLRRSIFYFLRHGETDWNKDHRAQGQMDVPLNATGIEQAKRASKIACDLDIVTICTSPLKRALDTAKMIQGSRRCNLEIIEDLSECSWGNREGDTKGRWFTDWKSGYANPAGAETYEIFIERALRGINLALKRPGPVMIVSHGGVYWAVQNYARLGEESDIPNATPVLHEPPQPNTGEWRTSVLTQAS